jgi:Tol biopolymer transport system component
MWKIKLRSIYTILTILSLTLLFSAGETNAQYFGQNKVNYTYFNFKELHTQHFDIYYYPEEFEGVKYAARMAERWYTRHRLVFEDTLNGRQPLILYASFPQFSETNVTQGVIGQGTGGFTEPLLRRIAMPFAGPLRETNHVIGHELVHAFQYDITGRHGKGGNPNMPALERLPLWFIEGMAEYLSLGPDDPFTAMWMREAAREKLPDVSDLENNNKYFPYRYGQALLSFITGKWGDRILGKLLTRAGRSGDINKSIDSVLKISTDSLSTLWHSAIHKQYDSLYNVTSRPIVYGKVLIKAKGEGTSLNVSPVLSPDGKNLVFFSSRNLFSIDIFLADAQTGKIKKTILSTALNTHLQNLEFINSAGSWDSHGKRFLFSAEDEGRPVLSVLNIETGDIEHQFRFPHMDEIFDPAWSPDNKYIVFSGLSHGLSNLFLYNIDADSLTNLTNDAYAELQPAWSPDGKKIAFVTDRFSTNLSNLDFGNYRLGIMNFQTKKIDSLYCFDTGKNINPQWTPDGKGVYFISNQNGINNLYKLDIADNNIIQVTNLYGGISGITDLSPAISIAKNVNKLVYSVYEKGNYNIYTLDSTAVLSANNSLTEFPKYVPGILPPQDRGDNTLVLNDLKNPEIGLPSDSSFTYSDYDASLSLIGAAQTNLGVGTDIFGTYVGGGVSLFWSDMLGNHNLVTGLQIQTLGSFKFTDISAVVGYYNTAHRWLYGGVIQQIPYNYYYYTTSIENVYNQPAYVQRQILVRQTDRGVNGVLSYPFNRNLRVEFTGGYSNITFLNEIQTTAVGINTGAILVNETTDQKLGPALNLGSGGAALVFDNSFFGATAPLLGQRYRLEIDPTFGSLNFYEILADYRHYIIPVKPFTLAGRILHYGRYGKDAEDYRLNPLYLGYPGLVRGYDYNSISASEYNSNPTYYSELYNRLTGSKMLIANFELRFPLLGVLGIGPGYYGYLPLDFGFFYDAGFAWSRGEKISIFGGNQKAVSSYGLVLRMNLFGYAVGELDYVHPMDRPDKKWVWQFNFVQGF